MDASVHPAGRCVGFWGFPRALRWEIEYALSFPRALPWAIVYALSFPRALPWAIGYALSFPRALPWAIGYALSGLFCVVMCRFFIFYFPSTPQPLNFSTPQPLNPSTSQPNFPFTASYTPLIPSSSPIFAFQPNPCNLLTSINLRGVPSGLLRSCSMAPV